MDGWIEGSRDGWEKKGQDGADARTDLKMQGYKDGRVATKKYGWRDIKRERWTAKEDG